LHVRLTRLAHNIVWDPLDITLYLWLIKFASDETLGDINSSLGVRTGLVLGCLTDKALLICECHVARRDSIAKLVGDDLNTAILVYTDA